MSVHAGLVAKATGSQVCSCYNRNRDMHKQEVPPGVPYTKKTNILCVPMQKCINIDTDMFAEDVSVLRRALFTGSTKLICNPGQ